MENMRLVDFRGHMTWNGRWMVGAKNGANFNTTATGRRSLFSEYLNSGAHEDNFDGRDPAPSASVLDNCTSKAFTQAHRADQEAARCRDRRRLLVCGVRRAAASATPATAASNQQSGQRVTAAGRSGARQPRAPIVCHRPYHDINIVRPHGTSPSRGSSPQRLGPRQAAAGQFRRRRKVS